MQNTNKKTNENPVKKTDVETAGLSGKVKQLMQTRYKAHLKAGSVFQGKIEMGYVSGHSSDPDNFIATYNEQGAQIQQQVFGSNGHCINCLNEKGQLYESTHYNKDGSLNQTTTHTFTENGSPLETIVRNADGSISYSTLNKYNDHGKVIEDTQTMGDGRIIRHTLNQYDEKGNRLSSVSYKADGSIDHQYLYKYNEQGKITEDITEYPDKPDSEYNRRTTHRYNEHGYCIETTFYYAGKKKNTYTYDHKYNSQNQCIETTSYSDGVASGINRHKYAPSGQCIQTTYSNADGSIRGTTAFSYNPQGKLSVETHHDADGNIERIQTLFYDAQGKHIRTDMTNADGSPYQWREDKRAEGETLQCEYDAQGNWIKKTTFYDKIPVNIYLRELFYQGDTRIPIHPLTLAGEEDTEEKPHPPMELSAEQANWLAEGAPTFDSFNVLRYYTLLYQEPPSITTYAGPNIEAIALLNLLKKNMHAQLIHSAGNVWYARREEIHRYTLNLHRGYILHATSISRSNEDEYQVPDHVTENNNDYDYVHFSQFQLMRPSDASGKRDTYFEEELQEYIDKCSLKKKPDKPTIQMIEVRGNAFAMVEHAVDDNFEIKNLDVNYGYGFEKFHTQLMKRFTTGTKGLVLFHGQPGTGKTFYIRHLLRKMVSIHHKAVIYMPPNMVDHLVEPAFMTFLSGAIKDWAGDGYFCVLLIEDAEPLLAKRQEGVRIQGVTNLLNMSDGILNDMLNLQIICTFNVDLKKLDSALLRPGRLIARKEFKPLSEIDANLLAQRLGIKHHFKKPATLGEVYAMLENKNTLIHDVEPDKGASKNIDDL